MEILYQQINPQRDIGLQAIKLERLLSLVKQQEAIGDIQKNI